jgi:nucleoside-diphosphate-sugar epimerase
MKQAVVAGGTGYLGRPLIEELCAQGFSVAAIARPKSIAKVPAGCHVIPGNVLDSSDWAGQVPEHSTFVHLVGVAHPSPAKASQFRSIDLAALEHSLDAAVRARVGHFVFVSVAHPAPVMRTYIEVRSRGEELIRQSGLNATILRPWYVLGPGHYWPYVLAPLY